MHSNRVLCAALAFALAAAGVGCGGSGGGSPPTYKISGTITGESGVTVTLSSPLTTQTATVTTDGSGAYSFPGVPNGSYTVTPSKAGYTCTPASRSVTVNGADVAGQDFAAAATTYAISGTIAGASDVLVTLTSAGLAPVLTSTDPLGQYAFTGLAGGRTYTVTPSKDGYTFAPASSDVALAGHDVAGQDFQATLITYAVAGTVRTLGEDGETLVGLPGATVSLTGAEVAYATTGADGSFALAAAPGQYVLAAAMSGYTMTADRAVQVLDAAVAGQDFTATLITYTIAGTVSDGANPLSGVTMTLSRGGQDLRSVTSSETGGYVFAGVAPGAYRITPSSATHSFTAQDVTVAAADVGNANFTGTLITYTITGSVTEAGAPLAGTTVAATRAGGTTPCTVTDAAYTCTVTPGTWTVAPTLNGKAFYPASVTVAVAANVTGQDFHVGQWRWQNPLPQGNVFTGVWGSAANDVWLLADQGVIQHWNGTALERVSIGNVIPVSMWGTGAGDIWAVGGNGLILHRGAGGVWVDESSNGGATKVTTANLQAVWGSGPSDVWAVGDILLEEGGGGAILHRGSDGIWRDVSSQDGAKVASTGLAAVWGTGPTDVWAVGRGGTIVRMDNASGLWQDASQQGGVAVTTQDLNDVWMASANDGWAVGGAGTILHLTADGLWHDVSGQDGAPITGGFSDVWGTGGEVWVAAGSTILHRKDGAWTASAVTGSALAVWGSSTTDLWAVGTRGEVFRSQNGTDWSCTWTAITTNDLNAVWASGPDDAWAVGLGNTILHFTGGAWIPVSVSLAQPQPVPPDFYGVWGSSADDVWVVGVARPPNVGTVSILLHWGGASVGWEDRTYNSSGARVLITAPEVVWGSGPNDVWVGGRAGNARSNPLMHYDGATWTALTGTTTPPRPAYSLTFSRIWGSGPSDVWVTGSGNIYHYNGTGWQAFPVSVTGMWGSGPGDVWFGTGIGQMSRYDGQNLVTWTGSAPTNWINSMWGTGANDIWGHDGNFMWHWNGNLWESIPTPGGYNLKLGGSGPTGVWAVGVGGAILRWQ